MLLYLISKPNFKIDFWKDISINFMIDMGEWNYQFQLSLNQVNDLPL